MHKNTHILFYLQKFIHGCLSLSQIFDKNINMLNVAVSRAKDSFILFGDERIFCDITTPSGKLFETVSKNRLNNLDNVFVLPGR